MSSPLRRWGRDLRDKLVLERRFFAEWRAVENQVARAAAREVADAGRLPDVALLAAGLGEPVLAEHYRAVDDVFSGRVEEELPADLKMTAEEKALLAAALGAAWLARARSQSRTIALTAAGDARRALATAESERERLASLTTGARSMGRREFGVVVGSVLQRRLQARTQAIAIVETNGPAELTKGAEARLLLGAPPIPSGGAGGSEDPEGAEPMKEWVTQGDQRVRPAHLAVDSDQVAVSEPFKVGGELLMFPGDTSLGASPWNVINCRCEARYDVAAIASARQRL